MSQQRSSGEYSSGIRIGSVAGAPLFIGWTWLLVAAFIRGPAASLVRGSSTLRSMGYTLGLAVASAADRANRVQLVGEVVHTVVGERDPLRVEGVRRRDVGTGPEVGAVDLLDRVRLGE